MNKVTRTIHLIVGLALMHGGAHAANVGTCDYIAPSGSSIRANKSVRLGGYFYTGKLDIRWFAQNFDLIDLNVKGEPQTVAALKGFNPNMLVFQQFLMSQLSIRQQGAQAVGGFDLAKMSPWLLKDSSGLVAKSHRGPYFLMMDIAGTDGWAAYFADYVTRVLKSTGSDGIVLDEVPLSIQVPFGKLAVYDTEAKIQDGTKKFLQSLRADIDFPVLINAGQLHYKRPDGKYLWEWLDDSIDGAWHEGWVRFYGAHDDPHSGELWELDIRSAEDFSANGRIYIASAAYRSVSELEYGLANYLLAVRGKSLVFQPMIEYRPDTRGGFNSDLVRESVEQHRDLFDVELGCAMEKRSLVEHIWIRNFEKGLVLVNPSNKGRWFKGSGKLSTDVRGNKVTFPLLLPAFGGKILLLSR